MTTSTMDEARTCLAGGARAPLWCVADQQTGGRGRHGRAWTSPPGNLHATLALRNPCEPAQAPELGFVAGLALRRAVAELAGLSSPRLALKWPNDLLLDGAKLAGVLLEGSSGPRGFGLLVGFGVNLAKAPDDTPYPAIALATAGIAVSPQMLLPALADAWLDVFALWQSAGFEAIRAQWLAHAAHLGAMITVRPAEGPISGVIDGIDERGRLLLSTDRGPRVIEAGDIVMPPIDH